MEDEGGLSAEPVLEVFEKDCEIALKIQRITEALEKDEEQCMKKIFSVCVGNGKVDEVCIRDKKGKQSEFRSCISNSLLTLAAGYRTCLNTCMKGRCREDCFDECKEVVLDVFTQVDSSLFIGYCYDKVFINSKQSIN